MFRGRFAVALAEKTRAQDFPYALWSLLVVIYSPFCVWTASACATTLALSAMATWIAAANFAREIAAHK